MGILLIVTVFFLTLQNVIFKILGEKYLKSDRDLFKAYSLTYGIDFVLFLFISFLNLNISLVTFLFAIFFGISFSLTILFFIKALKIGSMTITSLILSSSLLIPAVIGSLFLHEYFSAFKLLGVLFLIVSFYFILNIKKQHNISWEWLGYSLFAFIFNGTCGVLQKIHTLKMNSEQSNEFLMIGFLIANIVMIVMMQTNRKKEITFKFSPKIISLISIGAIMAASINKLVMVMSKTISANILYPFLNGGTLILTTIFSAVIFKEKLSIKQWIGLMVGLLSILVLSYY